MTFTSIERSLTLCTTLPHQVEEESKECHTRLWRSGTYSIRKERLQERAHKEGYCSYNHQARVKT